MTLQGEAGGWMAAVSGWVGEPPPLFGMSISLIFSRNQPMEIQVAHATGRKEVVFSGIRRGYKVLCTAGILFLIFGMIIACMSGLYRTGIDDSIYPALMFAIPGLLMISAFKGITIDSEYLIISKNIWPRKKQYIPLKNFKYILVTETGLYEAKPAIMAYEPTEAVSVFLVDKNGEKFDLGEYFPMTSAIKNNMALAKRISTSIAKPIVIDSKLKGN